MKADSGRSKKDTVERKDTTSKINRYWRSQPDDSRKSWAFLALGLSTSDSSNHIAHWQLTTGNAVQIVETHEQTTVSNSHEPLYTKIESLRQNEATLFTPTYDTLKHLRTFLVTSDSSEEPTLRGFNYIPLLEVIESNFAKGQFIDSVIGLLEDRPVEGKLEKDVSERCWQIRTAIGTLVPVDEIQGKRL